MTDYGLNDCTSLLNIIDIMNSLTVGLVCDGMESTTSHIHKMGGPGRVSWNTAADGL